MIDRMDRTFGPSSGLYVFTDRGMDPETGQWVTEVRSREGRLITFGLSDAGRVTVIPDRPAEAG